jgi:hypothetical protein
MNMTNIFKSILYLSIFYCFYNEDLKWDKRQTNKYLIFLKMANILISKSHNKS